MTKVIPDSDNGSGVIEVKVQKPDEEQIKPADGVNADRKNW